MLRKVDNKLGDVLDVPSFFWRQRRSAKILISSSAVRKKSETSSPCSHAPMLPCSHAPMFPVPFLSIVLPTMGMFTHHLGCPSRHGVGACSSVSPHHLSPCWSTAPFAWCSWTGRSPCAATLSRCFFGDRGQVSVSKWRNWFRVKQQLRCNYSMYSDRMGM